MFVEQKSETKGRFATWAEKKARRHPGVFTAGLILLAVGVTLGLLYKAGSVIVLYQGF
jgi:hypothetical protein